MVSLAVVPAPTWKVRVPALAPSMATPLNLVPASVRVISEPRAAYSALRLVRSPALLVALADCTDSSRMRCSMSETLPSAPSAVCDNDTASLALRIATFIPLTCAFMRSAIARPAESSLALLMRMPDDRRCTAWLRAPCEPPRLRCTLSDARLVLIMLGILYLLYAGGWNPKFRFLTDLNGRCFVLSGPSLTVDRLGLQLRLGIAADSTAVELLIDLAAAKL